MPRLIYRLSRVVFKITAGYSLVTFSSIEKHHQSIFSLLQSYSCLLSISDFVLHGQCRFDNNAFGHQNMNFPCIWSYNQFRRHSGGNWDFFGKRHTCKISTNQPIHNLRYSIDSCSFVEKKKCSNDVFNTRKSHQTVAGSNFKNFTGQSAG